MVVRAFPQGLKPLSIGRHNGGAEAPPFQSTGVVVEKGLAAVVMPAVSGSFDYVRRVAPNFAQDDERLKRHSRQSSESVAPYLSLQLCG